MNNHQVALEELKTLYEYIKDTSETNPHDVVRLVVSTFVQRLEWVINKLEDEKEVNKPSAYDPFSIIDDLKGTKRTALRLRVEDDNGHQ